MWNKYPYKNLRFMILFITAAMIVCSFSYAGLQSEITISTFGSKIENDTENNRDSDDYTVYQWDTSENKWTITPAKIYYWVHGKDPSATTFTPTSVTLKIHKDSDLIRTITLPKAKGEQQTTWDGKDDSGALVELGKYTATIEVEYAGKKAISKEHKVAVVKVDLEFQNSKMTTGKLIDQLVPPKNVRIGVIRGDAIAFKAILLPPEVTLKKEEYNWSGEESGTGPVISVTFDVVGHRTEMLSCLKVTRKAITTVAYVPPPNLDDWQTGINRFRAAIIWGLGQEALNWSRTNQVSLGGGISNGRADAARHAYWNVLITKHRLLGPTVAEEVTTAYERTNLEENRNHNEIVMDLENNARGRTIGMTLPANASRIDMRNAVVDALSAGRLTILDDLLNASEKGLLMPSSQ